MDVFEDPSSTEEEILAAAYRALCDHGYAELTMQSISAEFDKSVSLVYHHYDDKDNLVLSCLEFMLAEFEDDLASSPIADPDTALETFVGWALDPEIDGEQRQFLSFLTELRAQATHDEAYERHFTRTDDIFEAYLADVVHAGVEQGAFQECEPDVVAAYIVTLLTGVTQRRATHEDEAVWLHAVRQELDDYLDQHVYASQ